MRATESNIVATYMGHNGLRVHFVKDLKKVTKCPDCNNGQLTDFGDTKFCDRCEGYFKLASPQKGRQVVVKRTR